MFLSLIYPPNGKGCCDENVILHHEIVKHYLKMIIKSIPKYIRLHNDQNDLPGSTIETTNQKINHIMT